MKGNASLACTVRTMSSPWRMPCGCSWKKRGLPPSGRSPRAHALVVVTRVVSSRHDRVMADHAQRQSGEIRRVSLIHLVEQAFELSSQFFLERVFRCPGKPGFGNLFRLNGSPHLEEDLRDV